MTTRPLAIALLAFLAGLAPALAETLLVVRKTDDAVDFMDPGSALPLVGDALPPGPSDPPALWISEAVSDLTVSRGSKPTAWP